MSNGDGGPHGDKWTVAIDAGQLSKDEVLGALSLFYSAIPQGQQAVNLVVGTVIFLGSYSYGDGQ